MWVKALSASTRRSKQSLIVGTRWKKKETRLLFMAQLKRDPWGGGNQADLLGMRVNHWHFVGEDKCGEWTGVHVKEREGLIESPEARGEIMFLLLLSCTCVELSICLD